MNIIRKSHDNQSLPIELSAGKVHDSAEGVANAHDRRRLRLHKGLVGDLARFSAVWIVTLRLVVWKCMPNCQIPSPKFAKSQVYFQMPTVT